jgi:hypothetical protein
VVTRSADSHNRHSRRRSWHKSDSACRPRITGTPSSGEERGLALLRPNIDSMFLTTGFSPNQPFLRPATLHTHVAENLNAQEL